MNKNIEQKNDKKVFIKWVVILVIAFIGGGIAGAFSTPIAEILQKFASSIAVGSKGLAYVSLGIFVIVNVLAFVISICMYRKSKKMLEHMEGDEEEVLDIVEEKLGYALMPITIINSCNYFLLAITLYICLPMVEAVEIEALIIYFAALLVFMVSMFAGVVVQKKVVDLEKKLNPEKRGNIFDKDFMKDWVDSCDEAQQLMIYKASFKAYKTVSTICPILWVISIIGMLSFDTGLLPVFYVSIIMVAMQMSYYFESMKLEKGNR